MRHDDRRGSIQTEGIYGLFLLFLTHFSSDEGVISSIGVDGTGYEQFKAGPDQIISFTYTENLLFWVTQGKGETLCCVCVCVFY